MLTSVLILSGSPLITAPTCTRAYGRATRLCRSRSTNRVIWMKPHRNSNPSCRQTPKLPQKCNYVLYSHGICAERRRKELVLFRPGRCVRMCDVLKTHQGTFEILSINKNRCVNIQDEPYFLPRLRCKSIFKCSDPHSIPHEWHRRCLLLWFIILVMPNQAENGGLRGEAHLV